MFFSLVSAFRYILWMSSYKILMPLNAETRKENLTLSWITKLAYFIKEGGLTRCPPATYHAFHICSILTSFMKWNVIYLYPNWDLYVRPISWKSTQKIPIYLLIVSCHTVLPFSQYSLLYSATPLGPWTPKFYFLGFLHITLNFSNILDYFFNTHTNKKIARCSINLKQYNKRPCLYWIPLSVWVGHIHSIVWTIKHEYFTPYW